MTSLPSHKEAAAGFEPPMQDGLSSKEKLVDITETAVPIAYGPLAESKIPH